MITNKQLKQALTKYADRDLRQARKEGAKSMVITETKSGNLDLSYATGVYTIKAFNGGGLLAQGAAKVVRDFLVANYTVVIES